MPKFSHIADPFEAERHWKERAERAERERDEARRERDEAREVIARMIACTASAAHPDAKWAAEIGRRFFQEREEAGGG